MAVTDREEWPGSDEDSDDLKTAPFPGSPGSGVPFFSEAGGEWIEQFQREIVLLFKDLIADCRLNKGETMSDGNPKPTGPEDVHVDPSAAHMFGDWPFALQMSTAMIIIILDWHPGESASEHNALYFKGGGLAPGGSAPAHRNP
jgi:hypothetical protein